MKKIKFLKLLALFFCYVPFIIKADDNIAIIKDPNVIIKETASIESNNLYTVGVGTTINIDDYTLVEGPGCEEKWYKVSYMVVIYFHAHLCCRGRCVCIQSRKAT